SEREIGFIHKSSVAIERYRTHAFFDIHGSQTSEFLCQQRFKPVKCLGQHLKIISHIPCSKRCKNTLILQDMAISVQNWFSSWFDTPYYHILYKDRGYAEAQLFMQNLTRFLNLNPGDRILDLA